MKTKKSRFSAARLFRRLGLLALTLALLAALGGYVLLDAVFRGPSPIARDLLAQAMLEDQRLSWIPPLFLEEEILSGTAAGG